MADDRETANAMTGLARYPSLQDRTVFISGGASGIGASLVEQFAAQGSRVGFIDLADEAAMALCDAVADSGAPRPWYRHCDITDIAALQSAIAECGEALGPIRVLVSNAASDDRHQVAEVTPEYWRGRMAVNLDHQFFAAQAVAPGMAEAGGGAIVNMGSIAWQLGFPELTAYAAAKAAILSMTKSLARAWGPDEVRVNCILPGAILTERQRRLWMTPDYEAEVMKSQSLKRHLTPDEVARLTLFLASDDSSGMTGQGHVIDGGWI